MTGHKSVDMVRRYIKEADLFRNNALNKFRINENILNKISIVSVCYNSSFKLKKFVKKIPIETKIYIIDNSKDYSLKKIFRNKKNVNIFYKKNDGYGASINYASKKN